MKYEPPPHFVRTTVHTSPPHRTPSVSRSGPSRPLPPSLGRKGGNLRFPPDPPPFSRFDYSRSSLRSSTPYAQLGEHRPSASGGTQVPPSPWSGPGLRPAWPSPFGLCPSSHSVRTVLSFGPRSSALSRLRRPSLPVTINGVRSSPLIMVPVSYGRCAASLRPGFARPRPSAGPSGGFRFIWGVLRVDFEIVVFKAKFLNQRGENWLFNKMKSMAFLLNNI